MAISPRILGVDDNPRNLAILTKALRPDFDLVTAASGQEAIEKAMGLRPDLILLDIMMPGIDGYETCRRLRALPELTGTKIIMVSAKAMTSERLEGYAAGADDYVVKPFDQDELMAKVRVYLRLKSVEEVDRLKSDLLKLLSHETGTPLTGIMGALNLLRDTPPLSEEQEELVGVAESSVGRLLALVERVCLITQLKAGALPDIQEPVDLRALASAAVEDTRESAAQAGVTIAIAPGAPVAAVGDPKLLIWVIDALLDNAIRVSPRNGVVSVGFDANDSGTSLSVSDQGPGVEPALLARLFDEFVVADIEHHKKGSGLSLATARRIMEQHHGTLSVDSSIGQGARFRMGLPAGASLRAAA
jgi:signal transduction histidine kinase